jgi:hypothetical protein
MLPRVPKVPPVAAALAPPVLGAPAKLAAPAKPGVPARDRTPPVLKESDPPVFVFAKSVAPPQEGRRAIRILDAIVDRFMTGDFLD